MATDESIKRTTSTYNGVTVTKTEPQHGYAGPTFYSAQVKGKAW